MTSDAVSTLLLLPSTAVTLAQRTVESKTQATPLRKEAKMVIELLKLLTEIVKLIQMLI